MWKKLTAIALCLILLCTMTATALAAENETNETIVPSDYSDPANWLTIPEVLKEADTFYIYPTAYLDPAEGAPDVCDIDSEILRSGAADVYEQQATAYEAATNVFAPFYRQVNMFVAASATAEERDELLQKEPKADLYAALDYYFENLNDGRPFILAGHSQGSQMMTYVLSEYMREHPDYYERMIAAYALGYSITGKFLEENPHLKFAEGEDDLGVIISWNTEGEGNADAENFVVEEGAIAINPLNWKRDETYAGKEQCLGARIRNAETGEFEIIPEAADAQLNTKRGVVVTHTDVLEPMDEAFGFGPESYHGGDYTLWYSNIESNVQSRVDHYHTREAFADGADKAISTEEFLSDFLEAFHQREQVSSQYDDDMDVDTVEAIQTFAECAEAERGFYEKYSKARLQDAGVQFICDTYLYGLKAQYEAIDALLETPENDTIWALWNVGTGIRYRAIIELAENYGLTIDENELGYMREALEWTFLFEEEESEAAA